jgi:hypothetical protein
MREPQPLDLKYTLIIGDNEYILPNAPSGWEEGLLKWTKSEKYFGMLRSYSVPMLFHLDGAFLLRREFYTKGIGAKAVIKIDQLSRSTWNYALLYEGDIDFSTFKDRYKEVEVSIMESGISEMVKAYENVQYDIRLDETNSIEVNVPGIGLVEKAISIFGIRNFAVNADFYNVATIDIITNELNSQYVTIKSVDRILNIIPANLIDSEDWFARADQDTNVSFSGLLEGNTELRRADETAYIEIRNQANQLRATIATFVGVGLIPFNITFDEKFSVVEGERLFFIVRKTGLNGTLFSFVRLLEGEITVTNSLVTPTTSTRAMRPFDLYKELLKRMNNNTAVEAKSYILEEQWNQLVITSGDAIRQLPLQIIKTSFLEFYNSMNALLSVGFGIENGVAVLESKAYWMQAGLRTANIGIVKSLTLEVASNFIHNTIKVGYENNDYEVDYGREEVNSEQNWSTPITRIQKNLDLVSPYRADQFGIESVRTLPAEANVNEQDNKSDNDTFMIKIQAEPNVDGLYEIEGAEHYRPVDGIQGVSVRQSYYNLDLTPKKNMIRHGAFLRSMLHRYDGKYIRFESAEKNANLVTIDLDNTRIAESEWLNISSLEDRIFLPYIVTVEAKLPYNIAQLLLAFPNGVVKFTYENEEYEGFILEVTVNPPRNSSQEWKLILSPKTLIEKLIR